MVDSSLLIEPLPTHLELPVRGEPMPNVYEADQAQLLHESARPFFEVLHPDGRFCLATNVAVYYRYNDPPMSGWRLPDWCYVPGLDNTVDVYRRSFVVKDQVEAPKLVVEFASGDGKIERDAAKGTGKFWAYEQGIRAPWYALWVPDELELELWELREGRYHAAEPNEQGHLAVNDMGLRIGRWYGPYHGHTGWWMRFFDEFGELLPHADERIAEARRQTEEERLNALQERQSAERERHRAERERQSAERERHRAESAERSLNAEREARERLVAQLKAMGIEPIQ